MINVCPQCGVYRVEKAIRALGGCRALAICPDCGYAHPFLRLPLFLITGASGTGKTALALALAGQERTCVHLESDILWRAEFDHPENDYLDYRTTWLRLCKNIGQARRPVVLYGSTVPSQMEVSPERRYFGDLHYLALVCDSSVLVERLRARPAWRDAGGSEFVERMLTFNRWFKDHAADFGPAITLLDTSRLSLEDSARFVKDWISTRWAPLSESVQSAL